MKILIDYNQVSEETIIIEEAKYLNDYKIKLLFNDGNSKSIDFKQFLCKSLHPSLKKYLNENEFSKFEIIDGNLNWNNYEMIFPVADLYDGKI
jgi:hypothetical protein